MKIGSQLQFEIPDRCPDNCPYTEDMKQFSMTSICFRCPVINCASIDGPPDENGEVRKMCLIDPENFNDEWAEEWERFFKDGTTPEMRFVITNGGTKT